MLTQFEDSDKIFAAIRAGANGYLLKKDSPSAIKTAIIAAMQNESPINGIIANKVLAYFHKQQSVNIDTQTLTTRELEILQLIVKGFSYKEIAAQCHISTHTLNTHIKNIYQKLHVQCGPEAVAKAIRERII
jgi:DNA-binding NarL/FixJ family response regulator